MSQILLGISGGIAAYKTPELVRLLEKAGVCVSIVLTENAKRFVSELSLATVSSGSFLDNQRLFSKEIPHLKIERESDVFVVAPATANSIAKFAHGLADDALSTAFLAFQGPKIIVPAMHTEMWDADATKENIQTLRRRGCLILGPEVGELACGDYGAGRMVSLPLICLAVQAFLKSPLTLNGKRLLVSAGGTREAIDSVRVISNLSSGAMGQMLAQLATIYGAEVTLVTTVQPPFATPNLTVIQVNSAKEMADVLTAEVDKADVLLMAAAVSDFTVDASLTKLKRQDALSLELKGTADILKSLQSKKENKLFIGFCLADENLADVAREKLINKGLDYIVANSSQNLGAAKRSANIYKKGQSEAVSTLESVSVFELAYTILSLLE